MSDVIHLVPPPREPDHRERTNAETIEILEALLERARAGEVVSLVAISWGEPGGTVRVDMSTEDRMLALGAIRTIDHQLARDWLDR